MMIDSIRNKISKLVGTKHNFVFKGTRNQEEKFQGIISNSYNAIFTIVSDNHITKSFSYNDLLVGNIEIVD